MTSQNDEAKEALRQLLHAIDDCQNDLKNLNDWSIIDLIAGNAFMSAIKRDKITKVNQKLEGLNQLRKITQEKLSNVELGLVTDISNSKSDRFWDIWADNVYTDWKVGKEISAVSEQISSLKEDVRDLLDRLS
ncbi:hypothetical protein [Streptococcus halotolerans]|uniref:hypothetical protein n=1 Tax=Streptococcus halotolerans TaxID=1814128 RepID=UPI0007879670|nr:hypothetical protein [Streptococcus halotolerans]